MFLAVLLKPGRCNFEVMLQVDRSKVLINVLIKVDG